MSAAKNTASAWSVHGSSEPAVANTSKHWCTAHVALTQRKLRIPGVLRSPLHHSSLLRLVKHTGSWLHTDRWLWNRWPHHKTTSIIPIQPKMLRSWWAVLYTFTLHITVAPADGVLTLLAILHTYESWCYIQKRQQLLDFKAPLPREASKPTSYVTLAHKCFADALRSTAQGEFLLSFLPTGFQVV